MTDSVVVLWRIYTDTYTRTHIHTHRHTHKHTHTHSHTQRYTKTHTHTHKHTHTYIQTYRHTHTHDRRTQWCRVCSILESCSRLVLLKRGSLHICASQGVLFHNFLGMPDVRCPLYTWCTRTQYNVECRAAVVRHPLKINQQTHI